MENQNKWIVRSFVFTTILVFLSEWIQKNNIFSFPLGFRHLAIIMLFIFNWMFFGKSVKLSNSYKGVLIILFLFFIISFFFAESSLFNFSLGLIFTFLFVFMFILGVNTRTSKITVIKIFKSLITFIFFMSIYPILEGVINGTTLRWLPGFFREVGALGTMMNIGLIISLSLYKIIRKKKYLYLAVFFTFGVLLTILKKTMVSTLIVWFAFYLFESNAKSKLKIIISSIFIVVIGFFSVGEQFEKNIDQNVDYLNNVGAEGHVRLGMYLGSYEIAKDYFPFGSGLGSFASLSSIINGYSRVHYDYHVAYIGNNSPEDVKKGHHTLLDTFWPHILGELGVLGGIIYLYLWFFPVKKPLKLIRKNKEPFYRGISFFIILTNITVFWEGFSLYTPEIPGFVLIHSGLVGLTYYHIK